MICSAGPRVKTASRYLSYPSMSWFATTLGCHASSCAAQLQSPQLDTMEGISKVQPAHVFWSPERAPPTLAPDDPASTRCCWRGCSPPGKKESPSVQSVGVVASTDWLVLLPIFGTHCMRLCTSSACRRARGSRCSTQRQLRHHVKWSSPPGRSRAESIQVTVAFVSAQTWMTWW